MTWGKNTTLGNGKIRTHACKVLRLFTHDAAFSAGGIKMNLGNQIRNNFRLRILSLAIDKILATAGKFVKSAFPDRFPHGEGDKPLSTSRLCEITYEPRECYRFQNDASTRPPESSLGKKYGMALGNLATILPKPRVPRKNHRH